MSTRRQCLSSCWCLACCSASLSTRRGSPPRAIFSTMLTQVMVTGILGVGQTLVILTAGIDLSIGVIMVISSVVMGRLAVLDGIPIIHRFSARPSGRRRLRLPQWDFGHTAQNAPVHRDARHAQHHRRAQHLLFAERNDRNAGHRRQGLVPADHGQSGRDRLRPHHVGHVPAADRRGGRLVRPRTAPPTADTSTPRATTRRRRVSRASIPIIFCSASTSSQASLPRSPAGR